MQHQATGAGFLATRVGIDRIADERVTEVKHVNANLMSAPGVQRAEYQGAVSVFIVEQRFIVCDGGFPAAGVDDGHFETIYRVATDIGEYGALRWGWEPLNDGQIDFLCVAFGKLCAQRVVRAVVFCHNNAAAGILVQAVNNAGTLYSANAGKISAMVKQGVHKSPVRVACSGVYYHAALLVQHDEMLVFVEDAQGELLRDSGGRLRFRDVDVKSHADFHRCLRFAGRAVVRADRSAFDEALDASSREFRKMRREVSVEAIAGAVFHNVEHVTCGSGCGGRQSAGRSVRAAWLLRPSHRTSR